MLHIVDMNQWNQMMLIGSVERLHILLTPHLHQRPHDIISHPLRQIFAGGAETVIILKLEVSVIRNCALQDVNIISCIVRFWEMVIRIDILVSESRNVLKQNVVLVLWH